MRFGLRQRVAFWCATLVVVSGVVVVLVLVVLSGRFLKEGNRPDRLGVPVEALVSGSVPADAPAPPAGQPSGQTGSGSGSGPGTGAGAAGGVRGPTPLQEAQHAAADATFRKVRNLGLALVLGLTVVSIAVAWAVAGRIVRPLKQVTDAARSIAGDSRLDRRIAYDGAPDELHELADEFDAMLDKLEAVFDAQRAFVSNTSHELRTPLAVMRTEVDVALDDPQASTVELRAALGAVGDELNRTSGLVSAMLSLARAETITDPRVVDLAELARSVAMAEQSRHADRRYETALSAAPVSGDPVLLGQLVANLVRNAITYNFEGGLVSVRTETVGSSARIVVENEGSPVDPAIIPSLFSRFVRRSQAGEGHGLGMAICNTIVTTHGGTIAAAPRPGGGLVVTVGLPLVVPAEEPVPA